MTVPYQYHGKTLSSSSSPPLENNGKDYLSVFTSIPFWIWEKSSHRQEHIKTKGNCCSNHIVGLPIKNDKQYPLFDFQKLIYDALEQYQDISALKSRGIGLTTFVIRYLAWRILSSSDLDDKSIFIISGIREEHANYIKEKLQDLFVDKSPFLKLESKYTELWLKRTWIKLFPTKNIKDIRGYFEASFIWADESDHMKPLFRKNCFIPFVHMKRSQIAR